MSNLASVSSQNNNNINIITIILAMTPTIEQAL